MLLHAVNSSVPVSAGPEAMKDKLALVKDNKSSPQLPRLVRLCTTCCALVALLSAIPLRRDAQQLRLWLPSRAAAHTADCWTKHGGIHMAGGGVLHCSVPGAQLASSSDLSYSRESAPGGHGRGAPDDFNSPLVSEAFNIMFCWIPKNR